MELTEQSDVVEGKTALCYEVLQHLGDCYIAVDNYGQAGKCYEKAASLCPDLPQPYVGLGLTALGNNKLDDAEIAFRVARRLDGNCIRLTRAWPLWPTKGLIISLRSGCI